MCHFWCGHKCSTPLSECQGARLLGHRIKVYLVCLDSRWLRWQRVCLQCWRPGFDPYIGKIPWRWKWQPTPVILPRKWRSLVGYSPWGCKELDTTERLHFHFSVVGNCPAVFQMAVPSAFPSAMNASSCCTCCSCSRFWLF